MKTVLAISESPGLSISKVVVQKNGMRIIANGGQKRDAGSIACNRGKHEADHNCNEM
jgi:hypothetical protein